MDTNHNKTTALQSVDLIHPSGGQTMPSFTHWQADTSCKKLVTTQPTDIAYTLEGQIHP